jgi:hypothetical protein
MFDLPRRLPRGQESRLKKKNSCVRIVLEETERKKKKEAGACGCVCALWSKMKKIES